MQNKTKRLSEALDAIKLKGIYPVQLQKKAGGINSSVFKITASDQRSYALKIYPEAEYDNRNRMKSECNFYTFLNAIQCDASPRIILKSDKKNWCLLNWIEGEKINNLTTNNIKNIAEFISKINKYKNHKHARHLGPASEPCISINKFTNGIINKFEYTLNSHIHDNGSQATATWLNQTLKPILEIQVQNLREKHSSEHWADADIGSWISPSDVGIHNTICSQDKLYFIDFEYAGKDDLSKLMADWILQPNSPLLKSQEELLISHVLRLTCEDKSINQAWAQRLQDIKPLIHIKWCLILLKKRQSLEENTHQLRKTIKYFSEIVP